VDIFLDVLLFSISFSEKDKSFLSSEPLRIPTANMSITAITDPVRSQMELCDDGALWPGFDIAHDQALVCLNVSCKLAHGAICTDPQLIGNRCNESFIM